MQMHSNFMKNKTFTTPLSNETTVITKIVIFKACILKHLYQKSQTSEI